MKEEMKKFMEAAESNEELKAKIAEIENQSAEDIVKQMISLAAEYGCTLTEEDFKANDGELSEEELEGVSGGIWLGTTVNALPHKTIYYSGGPTNKAQTLEYTQAPKTVAPASNQPPQHQYI
ncbi:MAG: Nif11-like leader peptide family natural product precursor [Clostridiales bacterium]|nr:Nif11-like leader peptide family natural product precursor [Clostridiales bacterium]